MSGVLSFPGLLLRASDFVLPKKLRAAVQNCGFVVYFRSCERGEISPMPPAYYARRQVDFVRNKVIQGVPIAAAVSPVAGSGAAGVSEFRPPCGQVSPPSIPRARQRRHTTWFNIYAYLHQHQQQQPHQGLPPRPQPDTKSSNSQQRKGLAEAPPR